MAQFTPLNIDPNANGSYFSMQLRGGEEDLDIFAVFGLPADGDELDLGALRSFFRTQLVKHVAVGQLAGTARTQGPEIPSRLASNLGFRSPWHSSRSEKRNHADIVF